VRELLEEIASRRAQGERVAVATVVATRRSAPRPVGSSFMVAESGALAGSVSGGCVESDIVQEAQEVLATGEPKLLSYGISDDEGWSIGLPCGGEIDVFLERLPDAAGSGAVERPVPGAGAAAPATAPADPSAPDRQAP
jgi:xanthine dehydrogenase accessory factor